MDSLLLLLGAGFLAGAMNAVAGGGSFVSLPALVAAGLPSVTANASSTVALLPGAIASTYAYREDIRPLEAVSMKALFAISLAGGLLGALLLLWTPSPTFDLIVPWLLLVATLAFAFGARIGGWLRARVHIGPRELLCVQFVLAIYGGYFGGGVGIMMLSAWSLLVAAELKVLNPIRVLMIGVTNVVAAICFVVAGEVRWPETLVLLVGALAGGYVAARIARKIDQKILRRVIIVIASAMTAVFFVRAA